MRTKLTEKEKRARRRREALIDLGIFALLCLGACTPDLDGIGEQARKEAEANKTEAILEVNEEVEEISTEEEKTPQIENEEVEEVEEVSEVEEGETEESSEEQILETEEGGDETTEEPYYEETEEYPQEVEVVTEDYTFTTTELETDGELSEDYYEVMAQHLAEEIAARQEREETTEEEYYEETQEEAESSSENGLIYLGVYEVTAYEWTGNPCANGNYPTEGYTVACNSLPFGTVVYIEGIGYRTVEDRGADWHSSTWIDLYLGDENACYAFGRQYLNVYIVE